jgi:hypothetical protein
MLDKAVVAVKADQPVALAMFLKGEGGFRDRDLYPFCFRSGDGKTLASPPSVPAGMDVRTLKDPTGNVYGQELYAAARSRKVKSPKSAICFHGQAPTQSRTEGKLRNQGRRTGLRRRIPQVDRPHAGDACGPQPMPPFLKMTSAQWDVYRRCRRCRAA